VRARLATALAVALVTAAAVAPSVTAGDFVGMYSDDAFFGSPSYRTSVLASEAATGVQIVRQPFDWRRIEIAQGDYDFRDYDDFVLRAAVAGIRVLPVLGDPPPFRAAGYTRDDFWSPPFSNDEFAAFATRLVQRYGPNGTVWAAHPDVPALPIRSWQIWNEPNLVMFWNSGANTSAYTALLKAAGEAIHAADPGAEVVAAGLPDSRAGVPLEDFINGMYQAGAKGAFDAMAIHAYARDAAGALNVVARARTVMTAYGDPAPIWITEAGWPTDGPLSPYTVTEATQAANIRDLFDQAGTRRAALGIRGLVVFRWRDAISTFDAWPLHTGLVRGDGSVKPGLAAFRDGAAAVADPAMGAPAATAPPTQAAPSAPPTQIAPARARVAITGGELSRYGFLRVHMRCLSGSCAGSLRAGSTARACSGQRRFRLGQAAAAVLRVHLKGSPKRLRSCKRILVTAGTGPADPQAAAFLPKKPVRYAR
jgi:polysaccharide biosynthesis protein PslG